VKLDSDNPAPTIPHQATAALLASGPESSKCDMLEAPVNVSSDSILHVQGIVPSPVKKKKISLAELMK